MTSNEILNKVRKVTEIAKDKSLIKGVYFNPRFISSLLDKVPELKEIGFTGGVTRTESGEGTIVYGQLVAPNGQKLHLGTLLLDGANVLVKKELVTTDSFMEFLQENLPKDAVNNS